MNPARKRIHELLYGPKSPITRNLHEALDKVGAEWQADKDEITRLRAELEAATVGAQHAVPALDNKEKPQP